MNDDEKIVLNYHDSLVHKSDLRLLEPNQWLNDRIIGFVYDYFEHDLFKHLADKVAFVNPSSVQLLKMCSSLDEAKMCLLEPLELKDKEVVFLPLNNNTELSKAGGTHWSLLVFFKHDTTFKHYDSCMGSNSNQAILFYKKYKNYFQSNHFDDINNFSQQSNSSDCGVYLLGKLFIFNIFFNFNFDMFLFEYKAATKLIASNLNLNKEYLIENNLLTPSLISEFRKSIRNIIKDLN